MPNFTDQLNRKVRIPSLPCRIVSLVPSQTELLADLGLEEEVVGITKFCIHPPRWFKNKTRIGGTKRFHPEKIRELHPDLIIANKEENDKATLGTLMQEFPVWISDIYTLPDALEMIRSVGEITGKSNKAGEIANEIKNRFRVLSSYSLSGKKAAYFIWRKPWMVAGGQTFINDLMQRCGLINCFEALPRYPEISLLQLQKTDPDMILLSSEPYPFKEIHIPELRKYFPNVDIRLTDGQMFCWYGSRLLQIPDYFKTRFIQ